MATKLYVVSRGSRGYGAILSTHYKIETAELACQRAARLPGAQVCSVYEAQRTQNKATKTVALLRKVKIAKRVGFSVA